MKRILSTVLLCMLVSTTFAQKKAVKEAKKAMESDKISDARQLIQPALTDPETANNPDTWKLAADIELKAFEGEETKMREGKAPNEGTMYGSLYNTYDPYVKADELAQIPDNKGKINPKYRKEISNIMRRTHVYYVNGGVYYNKEKDYAKAADFFQRFWDMPSLDMFKDEPLEYNDTIMQTVKYYSAVCAIQAKDHNRAITLLNRIIDEKPFIENDSHKENEIYELLVGQYQHVGDSVRYLDLLKVGADKFPKSKYFVPSLINELIKKGQSEEALIYLDQAIANAPENSCELYSVKASIYTQKEDFDKSFESYEKAMAADPDCEKALDGLAVAYIVKAQNLKDQATQMTSSRKEQKAIDDQAIELYKKAYPLLEKFKTLLEARSADKSEIKSVLYKLTNAYYNLNMNAEYDAASKAYEAISGE